MREHDSMAGSPAQDGGAGEGEFVRLGEFARRIGVSRASAWGIVMVRAELPHYRFGDRTVRLSKADVEAYIAGSRSDAVG